MGRSPPTTSLDKAYFNNGRFADVRPARMPILLGGGLSEVQEGREAPDCGAAPLA
jgi:hypothetical protein